MQVPIKAATNDQLIIALSDLYQMSRNCAHNSFPEQKVIILSIQQPKPKESSFTVVNDREMLWHLRTWDHQIFNQKV